MCYITHLFITSTPTPTMKTFFPTMPAKLSTTPFITSSSVRSEWYRDFSGWFRFPLLLLLGFLFPLLSKNSLLLHYVVFMLRRSIPLHTSRFQSWSRFNYQGIPNNTPKSYTLTRSTRLSFSVVCSFSFNPHAKHPRTFPISNISISLTVFPENLSGYMCPRPKPMLSPAPPLS